MSIALFFISHEGIASNLLSIGESILKGKFENISYIEVPMDSDIDSIIDEAGKKIKKLDLSDDILFITDLYGSTPSNIAHKLADQYHTDLISGVNLPMVLRLLNYRDEDKQTLIQKALDGACKGIHKAT